MLYVSVNGSADEKFRDNELEQVLAFVKTAVEADLSHYVVFEYVKDTIAGD